MISQNSIDAYNNVQASGVLAIAQWRTYDYLHKNPGKTRNEIDTALAAILVKDSKYTLRLYSRRLSELERMTLLARGEPRKCSISGHMCDTWFTTNNMPVKVVEKKTWKQKFKAMEEIARDAISTVADLESHNKLQQRLVSLLGE